MKRGRREEEERALSSLPQTACYPLSAKCNATITLIFLRDKQKLSEFSNVITTTVVIMMMMIIMIISLIFLVT